MNRDVDNWLRRLIEQLERAMARSNAPLLDLEWLTRRCEDTLQYRGDRKTSSLEQLVEDLGQFVAEYPPSIPSPAALARRRRPRSRS